MNTHERIAVLERLLERVKRKTLEPRQTSAALAPAVVTVQAPEVRTRTLESIVTRPADAGAPAISPPVEAARRPEMPRAPSEVPPSGEWAVAAPVASLGSSPPLAETSEVEFSEDAIQELELLDDEIVDITTEVEGELPPPVETVSAEVEIDFDDEEEEPPSSSRRPKVASSMDEALSDAAAQMDLDADREVPIKTPPPESGPQAAMPLPTGLIQPPAPTDFDSGVHPTEELKVSLPQAGPTHAQLGQTIDLDEAEGPALELDMHAKSSLPSPPRDELEAALPEAGRSEPPHVRAPAFKPEPPEVIAEPQVIQRAVPSAAAAPANFSRGPQPSAPSTFLELLDESLALIGE